jgi:hypothetical protein
MSKENKRDKARKNEKETNKISRRKGRIKGER